MALSPVFGSIKPSQKQITTPESYLSFTDGNNDFAQQYLPEIYEQEVERYGNRTLSGFLRMVGAEMPMTSDQVVWSEQNRLHISYDGVVSTADVAIITIQEALNPADPADFVQNVISIGQTVVVTNTANGDELKCYVTDSSYAPASGLSAGQISVAPYTQQDLAVGAVDLTNLSTLKVFVYGSEFGKGTGDADINTVQPNFTQFSNSPIIIKERYQVNGSDMAQIGWVEVATEDGTSGYLWYLKAESETRLRFEDYLEMSVVEGELAATGSAALAAGKKGTQGLFAAIQDRGNVYAAFAPAAGDLTEFDEILANLDTQGAIEENMLFLNRSTSILIDDMLGGVNSYGTDGTSYGLFENSSDMALNLGFNGFRRGSYDFYKTDWKYLNDASTRGGVATPGIDGVLVPAGTSTVYDQILGTNIRRPFLHTRYRASQADDRRMKNWITGSAGGAYTSDLDAMEVHFLSERCLCVQGANNFVLFTA